MEWELINEEYDWVNDRRILFFKLLEKLSPYPEIMPTFLPTYPFSVQLGKVIIRPYKIWCDTCILNLITPYYQSKDIKILVELCKQTFLFPEYPMEVLYQYMYLCSMLLSALSP